MKILCSCAIMKIIIDNKGLTEYGVFLKGHDHQPCGSLTWKSYVYPTIDILFQGGSAGFIRSQHNEMHMSGSDSDSARTSGSSGARKKTTNIKRAPGARWADE